MTGAGIFQLVALCLVVAVTAIPLGRYMAAVYGARTDGVMTAIDEHTTSRPLGMLGDPGVNVLELNLALDG